MYFFARQYDSSRGEGIWHTVKKIRDSWIYFDQTFQGLGLGKLFPARESLVSDILAGDRKSLDLLYSA